MSLYRSRRDKKITGLCGGLGEEFNIDPTILRLILVVTAFVSGGAVVLLYVVASLVIPKEPGPEFPGGFGPGPGHNAYGPHYAPHYGNPRPNAYTSGTPGSNPSNAAAAGATPADNGHLDDMMKELEKRAMEKEIEQLKAKLAKYEKGDE